MVKGNRALKFFLGYMVGKAEFGYALGGFRKRGRGVGQANALKKVVPRQRSKFHFNSIKVF